jgi:hypothetical protein
MHNIPFSNTVAMFGKNVCGSDISFVITPARTEQLPISMMHIFWDTHKHAHGPNVPHIP